MKSCACSSLAWTEIDQILCMLENLILGTDIIFEILIKISNLFERNTNIDK